MPTQAITAEELRLLPRYGWRYELVRGELRRMSPAGFRHGSCAMRCGILLGGHVLEHRLGAALAAETGFLLARNPDTVQAPDFAFVRKERLAASPPVGYVEGAPDLAVEVASPGDSTAALEEKACCWLVHGSVLVWVVDQETRTVREYRQGAAARVLTATDDLVADDLLPGFRCAVAELFAG